MSLDGLLHLPGLDADVPLGDGGTAVLEELLHQGDIVIAVLIDFGGIVLPEAVGADVPIAQVVADRFQMPLNGPLRHWENSLLLRDTMVQAVAPDELIEGQRYGEHPGLPGFLLRDGQAVAFPVFDNVSKTELQDIGDPQSQVCLQH